VLANVQSQVDRMAAQLDDDAINPELCGESSELLQAISEAGDEDLSGSD